MAYEILDRLVPQKETVLLNRLHLSVEAKDRQRNKKNEIWEYSLDRKECRTHKFMKQKLDYMPAPVRTGTGGRPVRQA